MRIRLVVVCVAFVVTVGCLAIENRSTGSALAQSGQPRASADEQKLVQGIMLAPDAAAKMKGVVEFIKKYPKSGLRPQVAAGEAEQIAGLKDAAQKLTFAQQYQDIFNEPSEQGLIMPALIDAYAASQRPDEAFAKGSEFLTRNPDSVRVLVALMLAGTDQAKQKNAKFIPQSLQYGAHAIELIEADKKPADMDDTGWKKYKTTMLPALFQSMGLLNLVKGDRAETKSRLLKAAELAPADAFNYLLLAGVLNEEYQDAAKRYQTMAAGPAQDEELKKALSSLDQTIDALAHMVALSEGNAPLQGARQQSLQDLEAYYKYRHNNSTAGMQQLIDKYKILNLKP